MTDGAASASPAPRVRPSRRWFLVGGALAAVVGAGGGGLAEVLWRGRRVQGTPAPPADLVAAVTAERARIAAVDAALPGASAQLRRTLTAVRANHVAHEQVLQALLPAAPRGRARSSPTPQPTPSGPAPSRQSLRSGEAAAASAAAARALRLSGPPAALLASIAACEASHAELLS